MFARLWWKEARQTWPAWAFLAFVGLALQVLIRLLATPGPEEGVFVVAALIAVLANLLADIAYGALDPRIRVK